MSGSSLYLRFLNIFLIIGFLSSSLDAATIGTSRRKLDQLKRSLKNFESSLKSTNNQFSKVIDLKSQLFEDITKTEQVIDLTEDHLKNEMKKFKSTLLRYEALEYSVEENDLKLVTINRLKRKKDQILGDQKKVKELRKNLLSLQDKLSDYEFLEIDLIKKIESINRQVVVTKESLGKEKARHKNLKKRKVTNSKRRKKAVAKKNTPQKRVISEKKERVLLALPVSNAVKTEKDKDGGLNFVLEQKQQINSPGDGNVIYSGRLSKYGNVIVIGHKYGYRSILLGKFFSNVSKGQKVRKGEKLAEALEASVDGNKLYFELRKDKKKLIAESFLSQKI